MKNPFSMKDIYHEVFVVSFNKGVQVPEFNSTSLGKLGKWIKKAGVTWVCETQLTLSEFKEELLKGLSGHISEKDIVVKKGMLPIVGV